MENPQTYPADVSTDMLFSLPAELLLLIFTFVGFLNFRQDVRRLAVSKRWYPYARATLLSSLAWNTRYEWPIPLLMRKHARLAAAQQLTEHIDLTLQAEDRLTRSDNDWMPFNLETLEWLASALQSFTALRTLIIRSRDCQWSTIPSHVVPSFINLSQLTSLELDLIYMDIGTDHLCQSISQLIPSLKSLRCRLPLMCEELLESQPGNLKEFIISIKKSELNPLLPFHCSRGLLALHLERTRLETRLLQFAASMHDPKMVRLIYRDHDRGFRTYALDAIRDKRYLLTDTPDWDEDGVPLPEDCEEQGDVADEESHSEDDDGDAVPEYTTSLEDEDDGGD